MISNEDAAVHSQSTFAEVSIAGRGFMALEQLLFDDQFSNYETESYTCELVRAITVDIYTKANTLDVAWRTTFANELEQAGRGNGKQFLNSCEVAAAYLTSLTAGLEFIETSRLARPIGTLERARPKRAEAWRSERSLRNIQLNLQSIAALAEIIGEGNTPETTASFETTIAFANSIESKDFQDVDDISVKFALQSLLSLVNLTREAATVELSQYLGVATGFNALDGD